MMKFTFSALLLFFSLYAHGQLEQPRVINLDQVQKVELGSQAQQALYLYNPNAKILKQTHFEPRIPNWFANYPNELPMAVAADFNADRKKDIVVMIYSRMRGRAKIEIVALISKDHEYEAIAIESDFINSVTHIPAKLRIKNLRDFKVYLGLAEAAEKRALKTSKQLLKVEMQFGKTHLYMLKENKFVEVR